MVVFAGSKTTNDLHENIEREENKGFNCNFIVPGVWTFFCATEKWSQRPSPKHFAMQFRENLLLMLIIVLHESCLYIAKCSVVNITDKTHF